MLDPYHKSIYQVDASASSPSLNAFSLDTVASKPQYIAYDYINKGIDYFTPDFNIIRHLTFMEGEEEGERNLYGTWNSVVEAPVTGLALDAQTRTLYFSDTTKKIWRIEHFSGGGTNRTIYKESATGITNNTISVNPRDRYGGLMRSEVKRNNV